MNLIRKYNAWRLTDHGKEVYRLAKAEVVKVRSAGWTHYSIDMIVCTIRHMHRLEHGPDKDGFKVSNNHRAYLARDLMRDPILCLPERFFTVHETTDEKIGQQEMRLDA